MNRFAASMLLFAGVVSAQAPQMRPGATVYIQPMNGYETYLAAAFAKEHVALIVVTDMAKADYIVTSTFRQLAPRPSPTVVVNNTTNVNGGGNDAWTQGWNAGAAHLHYSGETGTTFASVAVIDPRTTQIVFAYSADNGTNKHQVEKTAEACAKHLKEFMAKRKK